VARPPLPGEWALAWQGQPVTTPARPPSQASRDAAVAGGVKRGQCAMWIIGNVESTSRAVGCAEGSPLRVAATLAGAAMRAVASAVLGARGRLQREVEEGSCGGARGHHSMSLGERASRLRCGERRA